MKINLAIIALLTFSTAYSSQSQIAHIDKSARFASHKLGNINLFHQDGQFLVMQDNNVHLVDSYCVDKKIRHIDTKQLAFFLAHGHIAVNKTDQGNFTLQANEHGVGGGAGGAWVGSTLGYGVVTFLGHGAIHLVASCTGPFYVPTANALTKMLIVPIHTASCTAGIAAGIALAVATGPV